MSQSVQQRAAIIDGGRNTAFAMFAIVAVLSIAAGSGCQSWIKGRFLRPFAEKKTAETSDNENRGTAVSPGDVSDDAEFESVLADGGAWSQSVDRMESKSRWQNRKLDEFLSRPRPRRDVLLRVLSGNNDIAAANAAIALARLGDPSGEERLAASVRSVRLKMPLRLAAAEALGSLRTPTVAAGIRELIGQYGDFRLDRKSQYVASLHVELLLALSEHVSPEGEPLFLEALDSPDGGVRLAAVGVWSQQRADLETASCKLPDTVADLAADTDPRVRSEALFAVARRRHSRAKELLEGGLCDGDIHVRIAAIGAIGEWGDASARELILPLLDERSSMIRAAAVEALAKLGAESDVLAAAGDKSWRVRAAVAASLSEVHGSEAKEIAYRLLDDNSIEVQERLVTSAGNWPLAQGGPVLLSAMESDSPRTRKLAAERLASIWPSAAHFPFASPQKRRDEVMRQLRAEFCEYQQRIGENSLVGKASAPRAASAPSDDGTAFEQIGKLTDDDVFARRRAAAKLAEISEERPLTRAGVERLVANVMGETDQLVWQNALSAVSHDDGEAAVRLAHAAVKHDSAEVRRRACEYLSNHPHPRHVPILMPVIEDHNLTVAKAAVEALGKCGPTADTGQMKKLLLTGNAALRLQTAVALIRLGDPDGADALRRLADNDDPRIRIEVAQEIGRVGDRTFIPILIRFLDDRAGVRREALAALEKISNQNPVYDYGPGRKTTSEQVELWKKWYKERYQQHL